MQSRIDKIKDIAKGNICIKDNVEFRFILIFQNAEAEDVAVISTMPLYKNGSSTITYTDDAVSSYGISYCTNAKVFKYLNDTWEEQTVSTFKGISYNKTYEVHEFKTYIGYIANYKIAYSNYPVFYVGNLVGKAEDTTLYNQHAEPIIYKQSDDKMTLKMLPPGAKIKMGRYQVNTSEIANLSWYICDYSQNFIKAEKTEGVTIDKNNVYLATANIIDILCYNNTEDKKRPEADLREAEIYKYLNSDNKTEWWYESFEGDTRPVEYPNGGFLRLFEQKEKDLIVETTQRTDRTSAIDGALITAKVHMPTVDEIGSTSASNYIDSTYINTCSMYSVKRIPYHPIMEYHQYSPQTDFEKRQLYFWKRNINPTADYKRLESESLTANREEDYLGNVRPQVYINGDTEVTQIVDENNAYSIVYARVETIPVENIYETQRRLLKNVVREFQTKKSTLKNIAHNVAMKRLILLGLPTILNTKRKIKKIELFDLKIRARRSIKKETTTEKPTKRDIIKSFSEEIRTKREINKSKFVYDMVLNSKRLVIKNYNVILNTKRDVSIKKPVELSLKTKRKAIKMFDNSLNTVRQLVNNKEFNTELVAKRKIIKKEIRELNTKRIVFKKVEFVKLYVIKRDIQKNFNEEIKTKRHIIERIMSDVLLKAHRRIITRDEITLKTIRKIQSQNEFHIKTARVIKKRFKNQLELLVAEKVKNDKGISNIEYKAVKDIKGKYYSVKNGIEATPVGLNSKVKYLLITKDKSIKEDNFIKINNSIYAIDMLTPYTNHVEIYLKEL